MGSSSSLFLSGFLGVSYRSDKSVEGSCVPGVTIVYDVKTKWLTSITSVKVFSLRVCSTVF